MVRFPAPEAGGLLAIHCLSCPLPSHAPPVYRRRPPGCLAHPPLPHLGASEVAAYAYLSLRGALLAYALWFRGVSRLPSVAVTSLGLLSPLTAVALGWVVLGHALTGMAMAGMFLVLASVLTVQWLATGLPEQGAKRP